MADVSPRKAQLLAVMDETDRETRDLLGSLSDADLAKKTDESNWTVGQLAGHVAQIPWAQRVVTRLSKNQDAGAPAPFGFLLNVGNWWTAQRFKKTSRAELLNVWSDAFASYRRFVEGLPDSVLDNGGDVPGRGRMTVSEFVQSGGQHTKEHGETIRRAVASR